MAENINSRTLMSQAKFYEAYSRFDDKKESYENWDSSVNRVMEMHKTKYKDKLVNKFGGVNLETLIDETGQAYKDKLFLGAQRALQFGGEQLLKQNARLYNCSVTYCDRLTSFNETMYMLLCGSGVGFSVQTHHINKMPKLHKYENPDTMVYVIDDSIEGWSDSILVLLSSYMDQKSQYYNKHIVFDYSEIRAKGAFISGGFKAPGPDPLRKCLENIIKLIENEFKTYNKNIIKMRSIIAYDIMMHLADAVISGGVRRSATICMFSKTDKEMLTAKTGNWFINNPQRGRSNNSVMLLRSETTKEEFDEIMKSVEDYGEPGFIWTDNLDYLFNPCVEIGMKPVTITGGSGFQMCNLTETNGAKSTTKEIFFKQCKYAAIMGTLQAGYTDFNYLSKTTKEIVEKEALIGVGITGVMNNPDILTNKEILEEGAEIVKFWNKITAELIKINQAARTTCIKPSGNASVLLECASGIHGEHSERFIRHVQFNKESEIAQFFMEKNPDMCEESVWGSTDIVVAFPIISPEGSIYKKDLLGIKQLEYVRQLQTTWIEAGTNKELGVDEYIRHNVSNTITVDDWKEVTNYIYDNRKDLCGVSLLAAAGDKAYPQAPFTEIFTHQEIVDKYGEVSLFTSALIEAALKAFNNDLWNATATALGFGEKLTEGNEDLLKRDFVRRFNKFAINFENCIECSDVDKSDYNNFIFDLDKTKTLIQNTDNKINSLKETLEIFEDFENINDTFKQIEKEINILNSTKQNYIKRINNLNGEINESKVHNSKQKAKEICVECLKDTYNLHKWWKINNNIKFIDFTNNLSKKTFTDIDTMGAQACAGGKCEL